MPRKRLLLFILLAFLSLLFLGAVLGAFLRLVNEIRYSLEYFLPYWLVTPVLLIAAVLALTLIFQVGWPWWKSFISKYKKNQSRDPNKQYLPKNRHQAAKKKS